MPSRIADEHEPAMRELIEENPTIWTYKAVSYVGLRNYAAPDSLDMQEAAYRAEKPIVVYAIKGESTDTDTMEVDGVQYAATLRGVTVLPRETNTKVTIASKTFKIMEADLRGHVWRLVMILSP